MSTTISGTGISRGTAIGKVYRLEQDQVEVYEAAISEKLIAEEVARFRCAAKWPVIA
ncbi:hypothetical protein MNBD_GAMMA13-71 [hydrothermal vent metagenome]|uniref:Phosphotransferase system enzyme I N-terminal domain-containing protein n=1 Tax=hydrothermal vent metagenome TaxID=652676 RepID=A0A3B0YPU9_9ZZZZ